MNKEILLNDFAIRSFRDVADYDYIAARLSYRAMLFPQFMWSGLQAVEKYLKCILLLNRVPAKNLNHDLGAAFNLATQKLPFELRLREPSKKIIQHLDNYGRYRYFESSYFVLGLELPKLDMAVWDIRRYCRSLDYMVTAQSGERHSLLDEEIANIIDAEKSPPQKFNIQGGMLEKILGNANHPGREALIWHNLFFGSRIRKKAKPNTHMAASNSPLSLHPEVLEAALEYIFLPKEVITAYRNHTVSTALED